MNKKFTNGVDLPQDITDRLEKYLPIIGELTHHKLTDTEINQALLFLVGLLLGKYPKIAANIPSKDMIRLPYVELKHLPSTNKLNAQEKLLFAFCANDLVHENAITSEGIARHFLNWEREKSPEMFEFFSSEQEISDKPFATSIDNPVKALSIPESYYYLDNLRTNDGLPVMYKRRGSVYKNGGIIDDYVLRFKESGKIREIEIYIDPYALENSTDTPEGLRLLEKNSLIETLKASAEKGNVDAMEELGYLYFNGKGVSLDEHEAFKWFQKAAEYGSPDSFFYLGVIYYEGKVVPQDYSEAMKWYKLAAQCGLVSAESNIGLMYSKGLGVKQDYAEALKWYRRAAEDGYPIAQNNLGEMYAHGKGVKQDLKEAIKWFTLAANQGFKNARIALDFYTRMLNTRNKKC